MRTYATRVGIITALLVATFGIPVSVFAQAPLAPQAPLPAPQTRRLTLDDAVKLALENNLGLQVARINPHLQDLSVALAALERFSGSFRLVDVLNHTNGADHRVVSIV